jgi:hypothetical protein
MAAIAVVVGFAAATMPAAAQAEEKGVFSYSGEVAGCEFTLKLNTNSESVTFEAKKCAGGTFVATVSAKYSKDAITLGNATSGGTIDGYSVTLNQSLGSESFSVGVDLNLLAAEIVAETQPPSVAQEAVDKIVKGAMSRVFELALSETFGGLLGSNGVVGKVQEAEQGFCEGYDGANQAHTNENCNPVDCTGGCGTVGSKTANAGGTQSTSAKEKEEGLESLCPGINTDQKKFVFVCLPSYIQGDLESGSKPLVLLPGGVLICLPIGGKDLFDLTTTPTISSSASIISLGGVIAGFNVKLKAPDIAFAAGVVGMVDKLIVEGTHIDLGSADLNDIMGAAQAYNSDSDLTKWATSISAVKDVNAPAENVFAKSIFEAPALLSGSEATLTPSADVTIGSSSKVTVAGQGGPGGEGVNDVGGKPLGEAPGGAKEEYGGSHGGYGGYSGSLIGEHWGYWQELQGRGPTFDNPFAPTLAGNGGSGGDDVDYGANGGGVVRIAAPKASVRIEGRIDADGNGLEHGFGEGDTGGAGAGAGGSIYLTAKSLAGSGQLSADGGGYCLPCFNGFGGMGGGGRIALIYGEDGEWSGSAHAHGGVDEQYSGDGGDDEYFAGTGGAGTLFTQQVAFESSGTIKEGKGEFPEGTLTIDGGRPAGTYPPPDGTPIADAWGGAGRKLVLSGEARAYAQNPSFGDIEVLGGSDLTSEFADQDLDVTASTLKVDATSRIDMSGHGYAGGPAGYEPSTEPEGGAAQTAPGQTPAVRDYGGSHGGAGGAPPGYLYPEEGDRPSSTYDDPSSPSLPGGGGAGGWDTTVGSPGGGVLDVTASTLQLDGLLSADGEDANGPNEDDPTPFADDGGAGAGGSVLVHAERLSGSGVVKADGGWACLTGGPPLLPEGNTCNTRGDGGAGGGGRVAVYATSCEWSGVLQAKGGSDQGAEGEDIAQSAGQDGSAEFFAEGGTCAALATKHESGGPSSTGTQQEGKAPKLTQRPVLSKLKLTKHGLSLHVNERATVKVKLARCHTTHMRRKGKLHAKTVCKDVKTATLHAKRAGTVHVKLPKRLHGRYRVTATATNSAGDKARPLVKTIAVR